MNKRQRKKAEKKWIDSNGHRPNAEWVRRKALYQLNNQHVNFGDETVKYLNAGLEAMMKDVEDGRATFLLGVENGG